MNIQQFFRAELVVSIACFRHVDANSLDNALDNLVQFEDAVMGISHMFKQTGGEIITEFKPRVLETDFRIEHPNKEELQQILYHINSLSKSFSDIKLTFKDAYCVSPTESSPGL